MFKYNLCRNNSIAGIAIEHGMRNRIDLNEFEGNPRGIWLWWDNDEDLLKSRFGQTHPCLSKTYLIVDNTFRGDKVAVYVRRTSDFALRENAFEDVGSRMDADKASTAGEAKDLRPQPRLRQWPTDERQPAGGTDMRADRHLLPEIGRASCRERV